MATSSVMAENLGYDLSPFEVARINSDILASFLEESHMEDADEERLTSVIQSLEAEISPAVRDHFTTLTGIKSGDDHGSMEELQLYGLRGSESYSTSSDFDFSWNDTGMACTTPSDELNSFLLDYSADETEDAVMFVDIEHHTQFWDGIFLKEHGYGPLWQEPYSFM